MPIRQQASLFLVLTMSASWAPAQDTPPPATDLPELRLAEIFATPIGGRGLEYSAKARSLAGQRVRVRGYMVRREAAPPGTFLLSPVPVQLHESEYGLVDDLPAATLFVEAPAWRGQTMPYAPGPLLVTGLLELGNREEPDGRISSVRLVLDGSDFTPNLDSTSTIQKEGTP